MFVKSVFKGESKEMARLMIEEIKDAFKDNLPNLKWMDSETRKLAKEKVSVIIVTFSIIFYPGRKLVLIIFPSSFIFVPGIYFKKSILFLLYGHFFLSLSFPLIHFKGMKFSIDEKFREESQK